MSRCPISYQICSPEKYSAAGLRKLRRGLTAVAPFNNDAIQGQPPSKFEINWHGNWAFGDVSPECEEMKINNKKSRFILIPPAKPFLQTSENIDLSTRIAQKCEIETVFHGMIFNIDQTLSFFAEVPGMSSPKSSQLTKCADALKSLKKPLKADTVEGIVEMIDNYCTFPVIEKYRLFQRILFSWLVGYQTACWKDYLLLQYPQKTILAPPLFFANTHLFFGRQDRELNLTIQGKNSAFEAKDFTQLLGREILQLPEEPIAYFLNSIKNNYSDIRHLVLNSFLSEELKELFLDGIVGRFSRLRL
jgi:serine/threonine-protein kinase HipA